MLEYAYHVVQMDVIYYNLTNESVCVILRTIYNVLGIDLKGYNELLGLYISRNEGVNFWFCVISSF